MQKFSYSNWNILTKLPKKQAEELFDYINQRQYDIIRLLKKQRRSEVFLFKYNGKNLVLKIPKEKNVRPWIRFTTLYRTGEAFKNLKSMDRLCEIGVKTSTPVMAAEKRSFGMVTDSWIIYEYVEGENCLEKKELYPAVVDLLSEIHNKGYLHNDPQIRNFITDGMEIYVIDSNVKRPLLKSSGRASEFSYLAKSAPGIDKHFGEIKKSWAYRIAVRKDHLERKFAQFRKKVKKAVGLN